MVFIVNSLIIEYKYIMCIPMVDILSKKFFKHTYKYEFIQKISDHKQEHIKKMMSSHVT